MDSEGGLMNVWLLMAGIVLLPVVGLAAFWLHAGLTHPVINDIVTDVSRPLAYRGMPVAADYPGEAFAGRQRESYPDVRPLLLETTPHRAYELAIGLVRERGWQVVVDDADDLRIEATTRSLIFRFTDEIAVEVTAVEEGARVDMRSRSRVGQSDLGVNAKRIRAFLQDLAAHSSGG